LTLVNVAADKKIVCYLSGWAKYRPLEGSYVVDKLDPFLCTHIVYTFAGLDENGNIVSLDLENDVRDRKLKSLQAAQPERKSLAIFFNAKTFPNLLSLCL